VGHVRERVTTFRSQVAAARSLNLSQWTSMRHVILPQAIRNIILPLLNDFISLQKETAQVGRHGSIEANKSADLRNGTVFNCSTTPAMWWRRSLS